MKPKAFAGMMILLLMTLAFSVFPVPTSAADKTLRIGVIQPEGWPQGQGMKEGAELAATWINDTGPGGGGGINVGGDRYFVNIRYGDDHSSDLDLPAAQDEMMRLITVDYCKFIYGGFRDECVFWMRPVAMDYKTPFFICGASTNELVDCGDGTCGACVRCDYDRYRYLFRLTPNSTTLVKNILSFLSYVPGMSVIPLMAQMYGDPVNTAVLAENLVWADVLYNAFVGGYLGPQANIVYATRTPYGETNFVPYLDAMHAAEVRLIVMLYSTPDSIPFMAQWAAHPIKAVPLGIDVLGQLRTHWVATAGACEFEAFLATTGYRTPISPTVTGVPSQPYTTQEFWDLYVATSGSWPMYTSWAVYDGIIALKETLEAADPADVKPYLDDPSTPWDGGSIIPYAEQTERYGIVGKFKFTGYGPHADLSEGDYASYTTDGGKTCLQINPTMKGVLHDVFSNEFLHEWRKGYQRPVWVQWQAGKLEVVWPKYGRPRIEYDYIGNKTCGASDQPSSANYVRFCRFKLIRDNVTLVSQTLRTRVSNGSAHIRMAIYTHNASGGDGSGAPGTLLAQTNEGTIDWTDWRDYTLSYTKQVQLNKTGYYWIGYITNNDTRIWDSEYIGYPYNRTWYTPHDYSDGFPKNWTVAGSYGERLTQEYATYTYIIHPPLSFWKRFIFPLRMWPYPLDLDYNGRVEMRDISLAARAFGSYPCHRRYDRGAALVVDDYPPGYDDEPVSMRDISTIARAFGTTYPLPVPY